MYEVLFNNHLRLVIYKQRGKIKRKSGWKFLKIFVDAGNIMSYFKILQSIYANIWSYFINLLTSIVSLICANKMRVAEHTRYIFSSIVVINMSDADRNTVKTPEEISFRQAMMPWTQSSIPKKEYLQFVLN